MLQSRGSQRVKRDLMTEQRQQRAHTVSCPRAVPHLILHVVMCSRDGIAAPHYRCKGTVI